MNDSTTGLISSERVGSAILSRAAPRRRYGRRSAAPAGARDRDRSRRPARPGRAAATVLVVGLALLGAAPAEAQTSRILVSNVSQAADDSANTSGNDHAQLFHTGDHTTGYTLTSVIVVSEDAEGDAFDVDICTADTTANEFPTSTCTALDAPMSFAAGNLEFTESLTLSANTNYVVVVKPRAGANVAIDSTTSGGEDSTSIDTMWSIKGYFYWNNSGTWTNQSGTNEALRIIVSGYERGGPTVTGVALTSDPGADATYAYYGSNLVAADVVEATVTFSAAVDITGTPQLELDFDGTPKAAACTAATNTTTMVCAYTVAENDSAPNGIAIAANKLTLNGGTIRPTGSTTINAVLTHAARAIDAGHKVDGVLPTLVTTGNNAPQTSADGTQVILTVSEDVGSVNLNSLNLIVGSSQNQQQGGTATFSGRTVTVTLLSSFTIQYGQTVTMTLGQGLVVDAAGNVSLPLTQNQAVTNNVPQPPAVITGVEITSDPGGDQIYATNDVIEVTATFDQAVNVSGTPRIEIRLVSGSYRWAEYASGSGTTALVFSYPVLATDESSIYGIAVGRSGLASDDVDLNGGTITVAATGENASLSYAPVASDSGHRVNWARPTLTGAETSTDGTQVILTFSEDLDGQVVDIVSGGGTIIFTVKVDGTAVTLSGTTATVSGNSVTLTLATALTSATQAVTVSYADLTTGDDSIGIEDLAGNDADSFTDQTVTNAVGSATTPTVTGVALTSDPGSDNTYAIGDAVAATVTFSAAVDITAAPQLELDFAGTAKAAACATGTNTTTMVCSYTVVVGDVAAGGVAIAANKLTGGTITATGSTTTADLTHTAVAIDAGHKVDGIRPTLVTTGSDAPTTSTDGTQVILTFSEAIGLVVQTKIDIGIGGGNIASTSAATVVAGTTVELDLSTFIDATVMLSVALAADAVEDNAENGNLALAETAVTNAIVPTPPGRPAAPSVSSGAGSTTSLLVTWTTPANTGPAIDNYDLQYRQGTSGNFTPGPQNVSGTSETITGLTPNTSYQVQVRATNSDGNSPWSESGSGQTNTAGNSAPTFANQTETRSVAENSSAGTYVGDPVTATDAENDPLAYSLEGTDASSFLIFSASGQIQTKEGVTYDYETTPSYTVIVKADDNNGGTDTVTVTIDLTDDVDERPLAPAAPRVTATPDTTDSLTVSWSAPSNTGRPAIDDYDLQYREGTTGTWTNGPQGVSGTSATIAGLTAAPTAYQVQVRATNSDGDGPWSPPGRISRGGGGGGGGGGGTEAVRPPSPPRDLTAMPGDQAVALSWRRPAENGGARIVRYEYRQQDGDGPVGAWQIIREDPPPTTHRVTGLTNGTSYTFQVRAVNNRHASPPSEPASATPEPELAPFEVTIVGVPEVAVAGASYELTAQSDAEEALVYAWRVAYGEGGSVEPTDTQTVVWTAPSGVNVAWIRVDATRAEDGATAGQSAYVRVEVVDQASLTLSAAPAPAEGGEPVTVTATLDTPASATGLTLTLTTGGTATRDTDYTLSSTTITLAEGETAGTVTITVIDDAEDDDGETIVIDAESTSPALTAEPLTLTIEDNDVTPVPALPLLGQLLLALGLTGAGARLLSRRPRVPPTA